jgi:RNA polymerase sigma factor for flagellar operon FliA
LNRADRDRIVLANLPLVGYLVSEVSAKAKHFDRDDLASAGTLALIACAEAYDPERGVPFSAYARHRILGAFTDEMRHNDWASRTTRRRITDATVTRDMLTNTLGRNPTVEEIAATLGVDRNRRSGLGDVNGPSRSWTTPRRTHDRHSASRKTPSSPTSRSVRARLRGNCRRRCGTS